MTESTLMSDDSAASTDLAPSPPALVGFGPAGARVAYPLLAAGVAVVILEAVHRSGWVHPLVFPSPFSVFRAMGEHAGNATMWRELWTTLQEAFWGFLIGGGAGFGIGVAIAMSRFVSRALYPFTVLFYSMPLIAFAPFFVALFGFGQTPKVLMAAAICFFPVLVNTVTGFRSVGDDDVSLMRSICAPRRQVFVRLLLPNALPTVVGGLKTTMTLAFIGAIVGEFTSSNAGIGRLVDEASVRLHIDDVFAYLIWLALTSMAIFLLIDVLARRLVFWKTD